ncbi:MAG: hypothetical protein ACP5P1_11335 [Acidimicrobiales bacterium]
MATRDGQLSQRTETASAQRSILAAMEIPDPPRFYDFTPTT